MLMRAHICSSDMNRADVYLFTYDKMLSFCGFGKEMVNWQRPGGELGVQCIWIIIQHSFYLFYLLSARLMENVRRHLHS